MQVRLVDILGKQFDEDDLALEGLLQITFSPTQIC